MFGWHLDGPTWPETPDGNRFALDAAVVGPRGLVELLETRLGVNGLARPAALRIARYLSRLRSVDDGRAFCSRSLAADGWATARLLLGWRDALVAGGWVASSGLWSGGRLGHIALAETGADESLAAGLADRVCSAVSNIRAPSPIDELELADSPEHLPLAWRRLLDALAAAGTKVVRRPLPTPGQNSDLARVQAMLGNRGLARIRHQLPAADADALALRGRAPSSRFDVLSSTPASSSGPRDQAGRRLDALTTKVGDGCGPGTLQGDGSFAMVRCDNELVAADIAAEWLAASPEANGDVVIVRQGDGTVLDAACHRLGLPRPGGSRLSPFRGALQSLPLAFETAWQPLDPERVLELLLMRGSPIPHGTGRWFAEVLRDFPGTGGGRWRQAWEKAEKRLSEELAAGGLDEPGRDRKLRKTLADWRQWLEPVRYPRDAGVPAKAADAICRKVQAWAIGRASTNADGIYLEAAGAASALAETIAASGLDPITKPQLDRMIDAVIAEGIARPGTVAEAAPWTAVDNPAQIWSEAQSVLWWGFSGSGTGVRALPWTAAERDELAAAGVALLAPEAAAALQLDAERRAILAARQQVLLIEPALTAAESTASHPIWHELTGLDGLDRAVVDGRTLRCGRRAALCGRTWDLEPVAARRLPEPIRDWSMPGDLIGPREVESATSLESLLGCPLNWVLRYQGHLRQTELLDMAEGNRLKGNVAHEVLARFFSGPAPDSPEQVREQVAALLEEMLPEIGSPLLLPGMIREREDLHRNTIESAVVLVGILKSRGLSVTGTERHHSHSLEDGSKLLGSIDLELESAEGQQAIVDLKWSDWDRYRRREIAEGRPIQLAVYSRLLNAGLLKKGRRHDFPPGAYFMMKQRRLLATDAEPFPPEFRVEGDELSRVWGGVMKARDSALAELAAGRVLAAGVETEGEAASEGAETGEARIAIDPPCRFCSFGRLCGFRALQ